MKRTAFCLRLPAQLGAAVDQLAYQQGRYRSDLVEALVAASGGQRVELLEVVVPGACNMRWTVRLSGDAITRLEQLGAEIGPAEALRRILVHHLHGQDVRVLAAGTGGNLVALFAVLALAGAIVLGMWLLSWWAGPSPADGDSSSSEKSRG